MYINYKKLLGSDPKIITDVDNNKLFIINRWASFNPNNRELCEKVSRLISGKVNKKVIKSLMFLSLNKKVPKYLKLEKEDDVLKDHLKKFYKFSEREYQIQKHLIVVDNILINELALKLGLNKKECKKIGANWVEPKKEKLRKEDLKPKAKGLGSYN